MKVKFKETRRVCQDGFKVERFYTGQVVELATSAACEVIRKGWAVRVMEAPPLADAMRDIALRDQMVAEDARQFWAEFDHAQVKLMRESRPVVTNPATPGFGVEAV